jgi:hypothetical protein
LKKGKTMKLVALKSIGRLRPGDEFDVKANEARVLKAIGKAKDAPPPAAPEPEPVLAREPEESPPRAVPRYRRRDMLAEEN